MSGVVEGGIVWKATVYVLGGLLTFISGKYWWDKKQEVAHKQSIREELDSFWDKREDDIRKSVELETKQNYLESEHKDMKEQMNKMSVQVQDVSFLIKDVASDVKTLVAIQQYKDKQEK